MEIRKETPAVARASFVGMRVVWVSAYFFSPHSPDEFARAVQTQDDFAIIIGRFVLTM